MGDRGESVGDICCDCVRLESALRDSGLTAGGRCCCDGAAGVIPADGQEKSFSDTCMEATTQATRNERR